MIAVTGVDHMRPDAPCEQLRSAGNRMPQHDKIDLHRFQVEGRIPPGTPVANPAGDPQLLAETRQHFWFQFDAGVGFQDIDTTFVQSDPERFSGLAAIIVDDAADNRILVIPGANEGLVPEDARACGKIPLPCTNPTRRTRP